MAGPREFLHSIWRRLSGAGYSNSEAGPQREHRPLNELPDAQEESQTANREQVTAEAVDVERLKAYLKEHPQMSYSYAEYDKFLDQQPEAPTEEQLDAWLTEKEVELRKDYATFLDVLPQDLREALPVFDQLKNQTFPEDANPDYLPDPKNPYAIAMKEISERVPAVVTPELGFVGKVKEHKDDDTYLDTLIAGRFQSFVMGAEILDDIARRHNRHEEGRAFVK